MKIKIKPITFELTFVAIAVIVLTVITLNQFEIARMKSRDVARKSDINNVSKNLDLYFADFKEYPDMGFNEFWGKEFIDKTGYVYIKFMPKENKEGKKPYCYMVSDDKKKYFLLMDLEFKGDGDYRQESYSGCGNDGYHYVTGNLGYKIEDLEGLNK